MSEDIYLNTGGSIQQPFQGQTPVIGTTPVSASIVAQAIASAQSPFTYSNRQPSTYRNPVNSQTPYIANGQQPFTFTATTTYPFIANGQASSPYPYIATGQQPSIGQARTPVTYSRIGRTPFTYSRSGRTPYPYIAATPYSYAASAQTTAAYSYPASAQTTVRQPYPASAQTAVRQPSIAANPSIYQHQQPYPYTANVQTTAQTIRQAILNVQTTSQLTYQTPYSYSVAQSESAQQPYPYIVTAYYQHTYQVPSTASQQSAVNATRQVSVQQNYQTPYIVQSTAQRSAETESSTAVNNQQPYIYQQPAIRVYQSTYYYPDPLLGTVNFWTAKINNYSTYDVEGIGFYHNLGTPIGQYGSPGTQGNLTPFLSPITSPAYFDMVSRAPTTGNTYTVTDSTPTSFGSGLHNTQFQYMKFYYFTQAGTWSNWKTVPKSQLSVVNPTTSVLSGVNISQGQQATLGPALPTSYFHYLSKKVEFY
jgi:hypothetical protein